MRRVPLSTPPSDSAALLRWCSQMIGEISRASNVEPGISPDLEAIEALVGTGFPARVAVDSWDLRTITGTAHEIAVANGAGVAGDPTLSLPTALTFTGKTVTGGTFASPTAITGVPDPSAAQDAATKNYVDVYGGIAAFASTNIASATTCNIGALTTPVARITGTVTITSLGSVANCRKYVVFAGALTLTHNATSLILPNAANIVTVAGDVAEFISDASGNWRCFFYVGSKVVLPAGGSINWANGGITVSEGSDILTFAGGQSYRFDNTLLPVTSDAAALGNSTLMWSDVFLAAGGVVNWNNGDVLATHAANALAFTGASSGYSFDAILNIPSLMFQSGGTDRVAISGGTQNVLDIVGQGNSKTTSLHLNPGSGTLPTDTVGEYVLHRTAAQAFGGNYGRVSLSALGATYSGIDTLLAEYGGTVTPTRFDFGIGIENPASTFVSYNFMSLFYSSGGGESSNQGAVAFGNDTQTAQRNAIALLRASIGSAGQRDSHAVIWEGKANDGTERAVWWRQFADVTSNAGASSFMLQRNLNGAGWTSVLDISSANAFAPGSSGLLTLGSTSLPWSDFYLASGKKIDWGNGDVAATHSTNQLAFTGADNGYTHDAPVIVGSTAIIATVAGSGGSVPSPFVHAVGVNTDGAKGALAAYRYDNAAGAPRVIMSKSRGTTATSYTVVQSGDSLGEVVFAGADGTDFAPGAAIRAVVNGTPGNNDMPTKLVFSTTPDGANAVSDWLEIYETGVQKLFNVSAAPGTTPSGGGFLYVDAGALKFKGSSGTVTTVAVA